MGNHGSQTYSKGLRRHQSLAFQIANDDKKGKNGLIYLQFSLKSFFVSRFSSKKIFLRVMLKKNVNRGRFTL